MGEGLAKPESTMEEIARLERQFREMVNNLKLDLMEKVKDIHIPGVDVHENGCTFAVVSSRAVNWNCLSPHHYIPKEQARAVMSELETATTVDAICKKVGGLLRDGYVGDRTDDRIYLNEHALCAIQDSDIGMYATSHGYAEKKPNKYLVTYEDGGRTYEATVHGQTTADGKAAFAKEYPNVRFVSMK